MMTKAELEALVSEAAAKVLVLEASHRRYEWLKKFATQMHLDELAERDASEWDEYIDKAANRR